MPFCIVEQDGSVILPPWALEVKSPHEVANECDHDVGVSIGLSQGKPDITFSVQGRQQRYPRIHLLIGECSSCIRWDPDSPDEAGPVQPTFVNVDDASGRFKKWQ